MFESQEQPILRVSPANDSLRAGSLVWTGSRSRELFLALPTVFLASPVLGTQTSEPATSEISFFPREH